MCIYILLLIDAPHKVQVVVDKTARQHFFMEGGGHAVRMCATLGANEANDDQKYDTAAAA
jgi:hypothetical protein